MGSWSIGHWIIVLIVVLVLFGAGRIPALMSDIAKGVKAFRKGMEENNELSIHKNQHQDDKDQKAG